MKRLLASVSIAAMMIAAPALAEMKQGGEMTVTFKDDLITLDPAIGYDWKNWSVIKSVFDGLMDYKPGTTELVPDLAESVDVSADVEDRMRIEIVVSAVVGVNVFALRPGLACDDGHRYRGDRGQQPQNRTLHLLPPLLVVQPFSLT